MEKILISACLVGEKCRYDGGENPFPFAEELAKKYELVPFCPEVAGGLSTPRDPAEIRKNSVVTATGKDVSAAYNAGAEAALKACKYFGIRIAILKDNSPSCGPRHIDDGNFTHTHIEGLGVTARLLIANGIKVYAETDSLDFLLGESEEVKQARLARNLKKEAEKKELQDQVKAGVITQEDMDRRLLQKKENEKAKRMHGHGGHFSHGYSHSSEGSYPGHNSYSHKPYGERAYGHNDGEHSEGGYGEHKSYGHKSYGEHSSYGHKSYGEHSSYGEHKSYGHSDYGEHKSYDHKPYGEHSSYEHKPYGEHKSYGNHEGYGEHKSYDHKPYGEHKSYGHNAYGEHKSYGHGDGEHKSYGNHEGYGERKSYDHKPYGEHKSYGHGDGEHKSYGHGGYGEHKNYGHSSGEHSNYGHSSYGAKRFNKGGYHSSYKKKVGGDGEK
jgi:uncharacterized protein YbbK (DUF523 family)